MLMFQIQLFKQEKVYIQVTLIIRIKDMSKSVRGMKEVRKAVHQA